MIYLLKVKGMLTVNGINFHRLIVCIPSLQQPQGFFSETDSILFDVNGDDDDDDYAYIDVLL